MKTKIIGLLLTILFAFSATIVMSGCLAPLVFEYGSGHWEIDFKQSDKMCRTVLKIITVDMYNDVVSINFEYADGIPTINNPRSGFYLLTHDVLNDGNEIEWRILYNYEDPWILSGYDERLNIIGIEFTVEEETYNSVKVSLIKTDDKVPPKPEPVPSSD